MGLFPENTLSSLNSNPFVQSIAVREVLLSDFAKVAKTYMEGVKKEVDGETPDQFRRPDEEAINFYALNHIVAVIKRKFTPNEPLPDWAARTVKAYLEVLKTQAPRIVTYTSLTIARESRHVQNYSTDELFSAMEEKFGSEFRKLYLTLKEKNEDESVKIILGAKKSDLTVGQYADGIYYGFMNGSWSQSFGGKKWGNIAFAFKNLLDGSLSLEGFIDRGYNLAHNGGPMFNKGFLYSPWGNEFLPMLDVQHSGQIPELIVHGVYPGYAFGLNVPEETKTLVKEAMAAFPEEFGTHVDWRNIRKLSKGAKGLKYDHHITQQKKYFPEDFDAVEPKVESHAPIVTGTTGTLPPFLAQVTGMGKITMTPYVGTQYTTAVPPDLYTIVPGVQVETFKKGRTTPKATWSTPLATSPFWHPKMKVPNLKPATLKVDKVSKKAHLKASVK